MAIKIVKTGYQVDIRPQGRRGPRLRKTFPRKLDAERWEKEQMALGLDPKYKAPVKDRRFLSDFCKLWFEMHGHTLKSGEVRLNEMLTICESLGNPVATSIDAKLFTDYRKKRLDSGITPNHMNHELTYFKGVFNELGRLGEWKLPNPFQSIKRLRFDERELSFLSMTEVGLLLEQCEVSASNDLLAKVKICLATGCRFGEAEKLKAEHIYAGKIHFTKTKTSKNRAVPISRELEIEIFTGRSRRGRLFRGSSRTGFENALDRANITLPDGQLTHVLRHTFASHFVMSGGNILDLQKILGHANIQMTMRYAHLAPEHLAEAVARNPLKLMEIKKAIGNVAGACKECGHIVDVKQEKLVHVDA